MDLKPADESMAMAQFPCAFETAALGHEHASGLVGVGSGSPTIAVMSAEFTAGEVEVEIVAGRRRI